MNFAPIIWHSFRIKRVTRGTLTSDTLAMAQALDEMMFVQGIFEELINVKIPIDCVIDCKSLYEAIRSEMEPVSKYLTCIAAMLTGIPAGNRYTGRHIDRFG